MEKNKNIENFEKNSILYLIDKISKLVYSIKEIDEDSFYEISEYIGKIDKRIDELSLDEKMIFLQIKARFYSRVKNIQEILKIKENIINILYDKKNINLEKSEKNKNFLDIANINIQNNDIEKAYLNLKKFYEYSADIGDEKICF